MVERRAAKGPSAPPRDPAIAEWFGGAATASGVSVTPATALQISTVYACVRVLAESVAMLPLILYNRRPDGGKERDESHPLFEVLHDRPNAWQTSFEFREMMMGHLALRGNAYAEIVPGQTQVVAELLPLHPDRVIPFRAPDGRIAYKHQSERGPERVLLQDEMFHLRGLSSDGVTGLSPIQLHRESLGLAVATQEHGARLFGNSARPDGVLTVPSVLDEEAEKALIAGWERRHRGSANAHRIDVLDGGMEWKQVGMTSEDAQFLETRKFQRGEIASIFRVPPHKIGDLERATFSNIEQQSIEFVTDTLMPWLVRWEQAISRDLFSPESRRTRFAEFLVAGLLRGDQASRFTAYATARQWGWLSANDIRRLETLNPIEGGDVYLSPTNMEPAPAVREGDPAPPLSLRGLLSPRPINGNANDPKQEARDA
jgi:HK97 family phage portal protein